MRAGEYGVSLGLKRLVVASGPIYEGSRDVGESLENNMLGSMSGPLFFVYGSPSIGPRAENLKFRGAVAWG